MKESSREDGSAPEPTGPYAVRMDLRIGVTQSPRELAIELSDDTDRAELRSKIDAALSGAVDVLWLVDKKERDVAAAFAFAGVRLDLGANAACGGDADVATSDAAVRVLVIEAREDRQILAAMRRVLGDPGR